MLLIGELGCSLISTRHYSIYWQIIDLEGGLDGIFLRVYFTLGCKLRNGGNLRIIGSRPSQYTPYILLWRILNDHFAHK